ncbi:CRISPR-associated protein Csy3 [Carnimonas sp. R-84981]|uniref:type I-F CRISPR-associated protein Csy3 n=1 Tax=Carnimonas bestiolae TaxID=3402172 RepID=UPI003EDBF311
MASNETKLKTASVLAFERKLDPSDALFSAGKWDDRENYQQWSGVPIREKSVRGTISNRLKAKDQDPARLDAQIENPNLQTVDVATLPHEADTLAVHFTLRVLAGAGHPSACNESAYQEKLLETITEYVSTHGFGELAHRYAQNLANARFLWRNRIGAEAVEVVVSQVREGAAEQQWTFNALDYSLRTFEGDAKTQELGQAIESALSGNSYLLLDVVAFARVGAGQEVFPSQELILERSRGDKSKTLYSIGDAHIAAIHSQKLGNALRTVDTWYPSLDDGRDLGPIAVEPYGSVTTQGAAYRQPRDKMDFYNLLDNWLLKDKVPPIEQQHFVMATLIRGGVFGDAG